MITVYKTDGTKVEHPKQELTREWMQAQVGGYIECAYGPVGTCLVVNEEGKLNELPINKEATEWFHRNIGKHDIIVGDAILVTPPDEIK